MIIIATPEPQRNNNNNKGTSAYLLNYQSDHMCAFISVFLVTAELI